MSRQRFGVPAARVYSTTLNGEEHKRVKELEDAQALVYPRVKTDINAISCEEFRTRYASLSPSESRDSDLVTLRGTSFDMTTTMHR